MIHLDKNFHFCKRGKEKVWLKKTHYEFSWVLLQGHKHLRYIFSHYIRIHQTLKTFSAKSLAVATAQKQTQTWSITCVNIMEKIVKKQLCSTRELVFQSSSTYDDSPRRQNKITSFFKCPLCPKEFLDKSTGMLHLQTHTQEMTEQYDKCEFKTYNQVLLRRHQEKILKELLAYTKAAAFHPYPKIFAPWNIIHQTLKTFPCSISGCDQGGFFCFHAFLRVIGNIAVGSWKVGILKTCIEIYWECHWSTWKSPAVDLNI